MKVENVVTTPFGRVGEFAIVRRDSPRVRRLLERGYLREVVESDAIVMTEQYEDEDEQGPQIVSTTSEDGDG